MSKRIIFLFALWLISGCASQPRQFNGAAMSHAEMNQVLDDRYATIVTVDNQILDVRQVEIDSTIVRYVNKTGKLAHIPTAEIAEFTVGTTKSELRTNGCTVGFGLIGFLAGGMVAIGMMFDESESNSLLKGLVTTGLGTYLGIITGGKTYPPGAEEDRYTLNPTWKSVYGASETHFLPGAVIAEQIGAWVGIAYNGQTGWTLRARMRIVDGGLLVPEPVFAEIFN